MTLLAVVSEAVNRIEAQARAQDVSVDIRIDANLPQIPPTPSLARGVR